ncbi:MAG: hypothetical protein ACFFAH_11625 [Promethearchaeota archaeon]
MVENLNINSKEFVPSIISGKSSFFFISFFVLFIFVHELGHLLTAILFGGKAIGITYSNLSFYAITKSNSVESRKAIVLGGSIFVFIVGSIIDSIAIIRNKVILHITMTIIITSEIMAWSVNAFLGLGDAAIYLRLMRANSLYIFRFVLIIFIIGIIYFLINIKISFKLISKYFK